MGLEQDIDVNLLHDTYQSLGMTGKNSDASKASTFIP